MPVMTTERRGFGLERDGLLITVEIPLHPPHLLIHERKKELELIIAERFVEEVNGSTGQLFKERLTEARQFNFDLTPVIAVPDGFGKYKKENAMIKRLGNLKDLINSEYHGSIFDENYETARLIYPSDIGNDKSKIVELYLKLIEKLANTATSPKNTRLDVRLFLDVLQDILKANLHCNVPSHIDYFDSYRDKTTFSKEFVQAIVEDNTSSFTYNTELQDLSRRLVSGKYDDLEKSRAIFEWITSNCAYDHEKVAKHEAKYSSYRGALQTFKERKGICGELAALQATMERLAGEKCYLALIASGGNAIKGRKDPYVLENTEGHAVAAHIRPNGETILVDPTSPEGFNCHYSGYVVVSDLKSLAR